MFPSGLVADPMIVTAKGDEIVDAGGSTFGPGDPMVEVTGGGGHPTAGEDTGGVGGLHLSALTPRWPPPRGPMVDGETGHRIGESPAPFRALLPFGDLAGDVGDDRPISG
jgi:hypothetical protein